MGKKTVCVCVCVHVRMYVIIMKMYITVYEVTKYFMPPSSQVII